MRKLFVISAITSIIGGYMYLKLYEDNLFYKKKFQIKIVNFKI